MKRIESLAQMLVQHNMISAKLAPWLAYALTHFCLSLIGYSFLLILGYFLVGIFPAAVFLLSFVALRRYVGGWHAASPIKCMLVSAAFEFAHLYLLYRLFTKTSLAVILIYFSVSVVTILLLAPLLPKSLHASQREFKASKLLSHIILAVEIFLAVVLYLRGLYSLFICVTLGIGCAALSLVIEKISLKKSEEFQNAQH